MLKTISHAEFMHFKEILKDYYTHLKSNPNTLVARFYGLHKIKQKSKGGYERIYFVVMSNVFKTTREINIRFDLKGST
jgi:1-phosphatidylinositol-4-phosphate 5-kinase